MFLKILMDPACRGRHAGRPLPHRNRRWPRRSHSRTVPALGGVGREVSNGNVSTAPSGLATTDCSRTWETLEQAVDGFAVEKVRVVIAV